MRMPKLQHCVSMLATYVVVLVGPAYTAASTGETTGVPSQAWPHAPSTTGQAAPQGTRKWSRKAGDSVICPSPTRPPRLGEQGLCIRGRGLLQLRASIPTAIYSAGVKHIHALESIA